jgi:DNA-binding MurR/RpiR family transcriptional regulator
MSNQDKQTIAQYLIDHPDICQMIAAAHFRVSRSTIQRVAREFKIARRPRIHLSK